MVRVILLIVTAAICSLGDLSAQQEGETSVVFIDSDSSPIPFVVVSVADTIVVSDENGLVRLLYSDMADNLSLSTSHVSFESLDTIIDSRLEFHQILLERRLLQTDTISIATNRSFVGRTDILIKGVKVIDNSVHLLYSKSNMDFLSHYNGEGLLLYSMKFDYRTTWIDKRLGSDRLYVKQGNNILEIVAQVDQYHVVARHSSKTYDDQRDIVIVDKNSMYRQVFTDLNQSFRLVRIDRETFEPKDVYSFTNSEGLTTAQYYERKIISEYRRSISTNDSSRVDYGFAIDNKLEDPNWDGDLLDLAISNDLVRMIGYQKHINIKLPLVRYAVAGNRVYFTHPYNHELVVVDLIGNESSRIALDQKSKVLTLITNAASNILLQIENRICKVENHEVMVVREIDKDQVLLAELNNRYLVYSIDHRGRKILEFLSLDNSDER